MNWKLTFKLILHEDSLVLIAFFVVLWLSLGLFVDSKIDDKRLVSHTGRIIQIDSVITSVKDKPFFKQVTKELHLTIEGEPDYFSSITTENFGSILQQVKYGDTVTIYTKPKIWMIFGLKENNDITKLKKGETLILDYKKYKQDASLMIYFALPFSIGLLILYFVRIKRRYLKYAQSGIK